MGYVFKDDSMMEYTANHLKLRKAFNILCIMILSYLTFQYYYGVSHGVYGMVMMCVQLSISYLLVKCYTSVNFKAIALSAIVAVVILSLINFYYVLLDYYLMPKVYDANSTIRFSFNSLTGLILLFLGYIVMYNEKTANENKDLMVLFALQFTISMIFCAWSTENIVRFQMPSEIFCIGLFLLQCVCGYLLYCLSTKWYVFGTILMAVYFSVIRLYMVNFCTDEVSVTGWAVTYVLFLFKQYLLLHGSFAVITIIVLYIYGRYTNKT